MDLTHFAIFYISLANLVISLVSCLGRNDRVAERELEAGAVV